MYHFFSFSEEKVERSFVQCQFCDLFSVTELNHGQPDIGPADSTAPKMMLSNAVFHKTNSYLKRHSNRLCKYY
jgi:hypothetical protein